MFGAIVAVLFVLGAVAAVVRPQYALLFIVLLFPAKQLLQASITALQTQGQLVNMAAGMVVLGAVGSLVMAKQDFLRGYWQGATACIALLYLQTLVGTIYTPSRDAAFFFLNQLWPYALLLLVGMPLLATRLENFRRILVPLLVTGSLVSLMIIFNPAARTYAGRLMLELGRDYRGVSYGNPLATAELGGMLMITASVMRTPRSAVLMLVRLVALVCGVYLAFATGSRGQVVFMFVTVALVIPISYNLKGFGGMLGVLMGGGLMLGTVYMVLGLLDPTSGGRWTEAALSEGVASRVGPVLATLEMFVKSPLNYFTGLGTSAFNAVNSYYASGDGNYQYPHNLIVETLTEQGLVGFGLLIGACWSTFRWSRRAAVLYTDHAEARGAIAVLLGMSVYAFLLAAKQGSLISLPTYFGWMILTAKICKAEVSLAQEQAARTTEHDAEHADAVESDDHGNLAAA
ncbi:MAG: O-antigen ligase family protein [Phycisphaerales bacterium]